MKKENLLKLSLLINKWKKKLLLDLTFCISLVGEIIFFSRKSQGILNRDVFGNHVKGIVLKNGSFGSNYSTSQRQIEIENVLGFYAR